MMELERNETTVGQAIVGFYNYDSGDPLIVWGSETGPFVSVEPSCTRISLRIRNDGRIPDTMLNRFIDIIESCITVVVGHLEGGMCVPVTLQKGTFQEIQFILEWINGSLGPLSIHMECAGEQYTYTRTVQVKAKPQ